MMLHRQMLHFAVLRQADHVQSVDAAVLGCCDHPGHQRIANTAVLPDPLDGKSSFGTNRPGSQKPAQLTHRTQFTVRKCAKDHRPDFENIIGVIAQKSITNPTAKPHMPDIAIQTEEMIKHRRLIHWPQPPDRRRNLKGIFNHDNELPGGCREHADDRQHISMSLMLQCGSNLKLSRIAQ